MGQSLVKNLMHLVFSTKHREPRISEDVASDLGKYQAGIFKKWESSALASGGVEDHLHALFSLSKNHPLKKLYPGRRSAAAPLRLPWADMFQPFGLNR